MAKSLRILFLTCMTNKEVREQLTKIIEALELQELRNQSIISEWGKDLKNINQVREEQKRLNQQMYRGWELVGSIPKNEIVNGWNNVAYAFYKFQNQFI